MLQLHLSFLSSLFRHLECDHSWPPMNQRTNHQLRSIAGSRVSLVAYSEKLLANWAQSIACSSCGRTCAGRSRGPPLGRRTRWSSHRASPSRWVHWKLRRPLPPLLPPVVAVTITINTTSTTTTTTIRRFPPCIKNEPQTSEKVRETESELASQLFMLIDRFRDHLLYILLYTIIAVHFVRSTSASLVVSAIVAAFKCSIWDNILLLITARLVLF